MKNMPHKELYESINLEMIREWIAERKEETVNLDFKLVGNSGMGKDDRNNLAKALSGFANSEGGILVWGVDARSDSDGVDCAQEIIGIDNVAKFLSKLNEFTSAVSPSVSGVLHKKVIIEEGRGLAVSLIPESDSGPHMAKARLNQYFKRTGDKFLVMEHFDVADMFGRRKRPKLMLEIAPSDHGNPDSHLFLLRLINNGRASAIAPSVRLVSTPACMTAWYYGVDGNGNRGMNKVLTVNPGEVFYGGNANDIIHPGSYINIDNISIPKAIVDGLATGQEVILQVYLGALDASTTHDSYRLSDIVSGNSSPLSSDSL
jgi:hypothetical protein